MHVLLDGFTELRCASGCPAAIRVPLGVPDDISTVFAGQYHACPALGGVLAPLLPVGMACKVEKVEREDYIGKELVQYDDTGRPIMAVVTTRDDGDDRIVLAPTAQAGVD